MTGPIRFRHVKAAAQSGAHALMAIMAEEKKRKTSALEKGTATHAIVFKTRRVIPWKGKQRRGKKWDEFREANPDAEILTAADFDKARRMADAVLSHRDAMSVLGGIRETPINWECLGVQCSGTPDAAQYDRYVTELKTSISAEPNKFTRLAMNMGYTASLAWYMDGIKAAGLGTPTEAYIVAVESSAPYPVTVFELTPNAIDKGRRRWMQWFERLLNYSRSNMWPPYSQCMVPMDEPDEFDFSELEAT